MAKKKRRDTGKPPAPRVSDLLRLPPGPVDLPAHDAGATPGFDGDKAAGKQALAALAPTISGLQERLFAHGRTGGKRRLLLVLQGMDTIRQGRHVRHAVGLMDPQGVRTSSFKAPTPENGDAASSGGSGRRCPAAGEVGVFDRSHYEDVLIARVRSLTTPATIERRYDAINDFEAKLVASGCDHRQGHAAHLPRGAEGPR